MKFGFGGFHLWAGSRTLLGVDNELDRQHQILQEKFNALNARKDRATTAEEEAQILKELRILCKDASKLLEIRPRRDESE